MNSLFVVATAVTSTVAVTATAGLAMRLKRRLDNLGTMAESISTESVAFNKDKYQDKVSYDKHSFIINGKRTLLVSGEFHPWRVPDRDRWRDLLLTYKMAGLNCIRIYIHWGFHSPAEDVYNFDGNRGIDYLLTLCEELNLFVLAAPGPYLCAETQAGGFPIWLVAKRDVRIRHMNTNFSRVFDEEYQRHCDSWLGHIYPILARHQITEKQGGCVIALQIENEYFENITVLPIGLSDDMRRICKKARDCGITVPFFHNDAWEAGSFVAQPWGNHQHFGKDKFGLDLYAVDKYVVWAPTTNPFATGGHSSADNWEEWKVKTIASAFDNMERTIRGFGGTAASGPIIVAELQGGWFHHYTLSCSYDAIYKFYGEDYTRLVAESSVAQGTSVFNIYMFYGGTNWGSLGDPDVYTSYDYSACIREFGYLSGRARKLRNFMTAMRSFSDLFTQSDPLEKSAVTVKASPSEFLAVQRQALRGGLLTFIRNFSTNKSTNYTIQLKSRPSVELKGQLPFKQSFVALGDYNIESAGIRLLNSTIPIMARTYVKVSGDSTAEVWVIQCDEVISGEFAFEGKVVPGNHNAFEPVTRYVPEGRATVVSFKGTQGWCSIKSGSVKGEELYILALTGDDIYTFFASFSAAEWVQSQNASLEADLPTCLAWGAYGIQHNAKSNKLDIEWERHQSALYVLSGEATLGVGHLKQVSGVDASSPFAGFPGLRMYQRPALDVTLPSDAPLAEIEITAQRATNLASLPWQTVTVTKDGVPEKNMIDLAYTSSHALYRVRFEASNPATGLELSLDARNRASVFINGKPLSGHVTYNLGLLKAGAKAGPDLFSDPKTYEIPANMQIPGTTNDVVIIIESFGLSRQCGVFNDVRNAKGVKNVKLSVKPAAKSSIPFMATPKTPVPFHLEVTGVDVRTVPQAYGITGFPDEPGPAAESTGLNNLSWSPVADAASFKSSSSVRLTAVSNGAPTWFKGTLRGTPVLATAAAQVSSSSSSPSTQTNTLRVPLRLRVTGPGTAHVLINGLYMVRYRGNGDSVQMDFIIPESITSKAVAEGGKGLQNVEVVVLVYSAGNPSVAEAAKGAGKREDAGWVSLEVLGWSTPTMVAKDLEMRWSGNRVEKGGYTFGTIRQQL